MATESVRFVRSSRDVSTNPDDFELEVTRVFFLRRHRVSYHVLVVIQSLQASDAGKVNDAVDELIDVCVALAPVDVVEEEFAVETQASEFVEMPDDLVSITALTLLTTETWRKQRLMIWMGLRTNRLNQGRSDRLLD